ncbi:transcriptional regulator [Cohnella nanjingensis]|uniref:Transcriptional regulator n=1 Tax=Cohnella nanjingensis TaxID=1387779 RepID=A0A7X0RSY8_9BACL|nr:transcriptional regulator [Cohnella nanjingensis]MBB6673010.1 transcriptional regulator [Cohnella nanjingensis]
MGKKMTWSRLPGMTSSTIRPEDIPPAPGVDVEAIKAGDADPLEVVVEVPAGKSTRGWNYKPESLKAIVDHVNRDTLSGFLGHQKPEDVSSAFEAPVTHWVGAKMDGANAYFRGVIDAAASDLKRWIRARRIKQVSIFGMPKLATVAGETDVVDYRPLSIDWTPLDRSGMPTRIVATGEMDVLEEDEDQGGTQVNWKELIAQLLALVSGGTVSVTDIMAELDPEGSAKAKQDAELIASIRTALGIADDGDVLAAVTEAAKAQADAGKTDPNALVNNAVKSKVAGEMAQQLIAKMLHPKEDATQEQITGELDALLATPNVKEMISKLHLDHTLTGDGAGGTAATKRTASI